MFETLHKILLWIHIPVGTLALILFWIPVGVKKGSPLHRKVGRYYYYCMWTVLITAALMCIVDLFLDKYMQAMFLGYLSIITSYPLWYSYEILNQKNEWSDRYYYTRKAFLGLTFMTAIGMLYIGYTYFQFRNMGTVIGFFGLLGLPTIREVLMTKPTAMDKESRMNMHIKGTIISGIAAYTAFLAFGGSRLLMHLQLDPQWMTLPWVAPTVLGVIYMRYMKKKYGTKSTKKKVATYQSIGL